MNVDKEMVLGFACCKSCTRLGMLYCGHEEYQDCLALRLSVYARRAWLDLREWTLCKRRFMAVIFASFFVIIGETITTSLQSALNIML